MMKFFKTCALLLALTPAVAVFTEDFESFAPGDVIDEIVSGNSFTIGVKAKGCSGEAMIFDSASPTGGDTDLSTTGKGNILIVSEDGDSTDPDDCGAGSVLKFRFAPHAYVSSIGLLDIDEGARILVFPSTGASYGINVPPTLDNGYVSFPIHETVTKINVKFFGSGAVTEIEYNKPCPAGSNCIKITGTSASAGELGWFVVDVAIFGVKTSLVASEFVDFSFADPLGTAVIDPSNVPADTGVTHFGFVNGEWTVTGGGNDSLTALNGDRVWIAGTSYAVVGQFGSHSFSDVTWSTVSYVY